MSNMSKRILRWLALMCLSVTSARCYGPYGGYTLRDRGLRQVRRCPTCPPDCPESLASPWYGTPTVYGKPVTFKGSNQEAKRPAGYSQSQALLRDSPSLYGSPYFSGSNNYLSSNARSARSENASPDVSTAAETSPDTEDSFDPTGGFSPVESRGLLPYGYPRASRASFLPEMYQDPVAFRSTPMEHPRFSRHYGNAYEEAIRDQLIDQESSALNSPRWNDVSFPQQSVDTYENSQDTFYEDRLKTIESPSHKKVYVVYRADADYSTDDDDELMNSSRQQQQQQQQQQHQQQQLEQMMEKSAIEAANPLTEPQLEHYVRRAVAAATMQNMQNEKLYGHQQRRGIFYNEHERDQEQSYNQRRPYNDELYRRFNNQDAIDSQERRKQQHYATGYGSRPEIVYTPTMRYSPYALTGVNGPQNPSPQREVLPESNARSRHIYPPEIAAWQGHALQSNVEENTREPVNQYASQVQQPTRLYEEGARDDQETSGHREHQPNRSESTQDFSATTGDVDFKNLPAPINYRTRSRSADATATSSSGRRETDGIEESERKLMGNLPSDGEKGAGAASMEFNPDLMEDIEMPPTDNSEVELKLNFETSDNSTPPPKN